jgi:WD40 repeat protein
MLKRLTTLVLIMTISSVGPIFSQPTMQPPSASYISDITWSPDGEMIAFAVGTNPEEPCYSDFDLYAIRFIDTSTGNQIRTFHENTFCPINSLDFSPAEEKIASVSRDGLLQVWNLNSNTLQISNQRSTERHNLQWSSNGQKLLVVYDNGVEIFSGNISFQAPNRTGAFVAAPLMIPEIMDAVWGPNNNHIAIGDVEGDIHIWDSFANDVILDLQHGTTAISALAWNTVTNQLASAGEDGSLRIWDPTNGSVVFMLQGHTDTITALAWRPDGAYLASASLDGTLRTWDAQTGMEVGMLELEGGVYALDWSPNGQQIAYGGLAAQTPAPLITTPPGVTPAPTATPTPVANSSDASTSILTDAQVNTEFDDVNSIDWSPDGTKIAVGAGPATCTETPTTAHAVRIYNASSGAVISNLIGHRCSVISVAWSPDSTVIASSGTSGIVIAWNASNEQLLYSVPPTGPGISSLSWRSDGTQFVGVSLASGGVFSWDADTGTRSTTQVVAIPDERPQRHTLLSEWRPNSPEIAIGKSDGALEIWDSTSGNFVRALTGHTQSIQGIDWRSDGSRLASGSADGTVRVWDSVTGESLLTLQSGIVWDVAWSLDGSKLATAGDDGTVRVWDTISGQQLNSLPYPGRVFAVAWSPDGNQLAYGGRRLDGQPARVVIQPSNPSPAPTATPTPVQSGSAGSYPDGVVAWHPDGEIIAVGRGTTVEIIERTTMRVLNTFGNFKDFTLYRGEIAWSPDGSSLAITDGADVAVWQNPWDALNAQLVSTYQYYLDYDPPTPATNVAAITWSSDSQFIASATGIRIDIWEAVSGQRQRKFQSEAGAIFDLDWSTDNRLAVAGLDSFVDVYDPDTGNFLNAFYTQPPSAALPPGIWSIAFSPDNTELALGFRNGRIRVWGNTNATIEVSEEARIEMWGHDDMIFALRWSADGTYIASGSRDGTISVWESATGEAVQVIDVGAPLRSFDWRPAANELAYLDGSGALRFTQVPMPAPTATSTPAADSSGTSTPSLAAAALRDLLTAPTCQRACFLGIRPGITTQAEVQNILVGLNIPYDVDAGRSNNDEPNGTYYWVPPTSTPFTNGGGVILHFSDGIARQMLVSMSVAVNTVIDAFGAPVTVAETDDTYYLEYADLGLVFRVSSRTDPTRANGAILTADPALNNRFVGGTYGQSSVNQPCPTYGTTPCIAPTATPVSTATLLPTATRNAYAAVETPLDYAGVLGLAWSPDSSRLASANANGSVYLYDRTQHLQMTLPAHTGRAHAVAWSPDGRLLATSGDDAVIRIWDASDYSLVTTLTGHRDPVTWIDWSPDGRKLASLGLAETYNLRIWDTTSWEQIAAPNVGTISVMRWSPDSAMFLITGYVLGIGNSENYGAEYTFSGHESFVISANWSLDGGRIVSSSMDGTVRLWDTTTRSEIGILAQPGTEVWDLAFSPDGRYVAGAVGLSGIQVWDTRNGEIIETLPQENPSSLAWSPDGTLFAYGGYSIDGENLQPIIIPAPGLQPASTATPVSTRRP